MTSIVPVWYGKYWTLKVVEASVSLSECSAHWVKDGVGLMREHYHCITTAGSLIDFYITGGFSL